MPGRTPPSVCNRKRLPRREQLKHSSTRRNPFRKIQNSPLCGSDSWIFLSQDLVFAAQAAPAPCADCLLVTDQPEGVQPCSGAMTPGSASATIHQSAQKTKLPISCPLRLVEAPLKRMGAWTPCPRLPCRTICTSGWNFLLREGFALRSKYLTV